MYPFPGFMFRLVDAESTQAIRKDNSQELSQVQYVEQNMVIVLSRPAKSETKVASALLTFKIRFAKEFSYTTTSADPSC